MWRFAVALLVARLTAVHAQLTADGTAAVEIRYELDVTGPQLATNEVVLALPRLGVATGATVSVDGDAHAHPLALAAAAGVADAWTALAAAAGSAAPWAFALHAWDPHESAVALDVAAPRAAHVVIDLAVAAPTCFYRDVRYVAIARAWLPFAPLGQRAAMTAALDAACANGLGSWPDAERAPVAWLRLPTAELTARPHGAQRIGTTARVLEIPGADLARVEVALAAEIAAPPPDLYTAIVVDASRSLDDDMRAEQRALVARYLAAAPGRVQVIAYARRAEALLPDWSATAAARPYVDFALHALEPANGSNLDAALAEAGRWLAKVDGTRRVIAFTDEQLPWRLGGSGGSGAAAHVDIDRIRGTLPAGTLVHTVALAGVLGGGLVRDDDAALSPLAQATGGEAFRSAEAPAAADPGHLLDTAALIAPAALDHVRIAAPGWQRLVAGDASPCSAAADYDNKPLRPLALGAACTWLGLARRGAHWPPPIRISGDLWGAHVERELAIERAGAPQLARAILATLDGLGVPRGPAPPELAGVHAALDRAARAVDATWSLAATWGDDHGAGRGGYAGRAVRLAGPAPQPCNCLQKPDDSARAVYARWRAHGRSVHDQLTSAIAKCHPTGGRVAIDLELTGVEIVDVAVDAPPAEAACITDAVWASTIDAAGRPAHRKEHLEWP